MDNIDKEGNEVDSEGDHDYGEEGEFEMDEETIKKLREQGYEIHGDDGEEPEEADYGSDYGDEEDGEGDDDGYGDEEYDDEDSEEGAGNGIGKRGARDTEEGGANKKSKK